ncbi:hypothetical protein D3C76_1418320 [compost metagenome]
MLMFSCPLLLRSSDQALTRLANRPMAAIIIMVPLATSGGEPMRWKASHIIKPEITNKVTPLNRAAIISNR